ncbi:MAG: LemA family protein [Clostridia bacterium]
MINALFIFLTILVVVTIFCLILIVGIYNKLVNLKMKVKNALAQIDTQLKLRFDLIPNLVETVKAYMKHEENTLTEIIEARNSFGSAKTFDEKKDATNTLGKTLKSIFALSEAYPELKANENFKSLQASLSETEGKIAYSRQFYNDIVQIYNASIKSFPSNIVANIFNFKEEPFFELTFADQRENVKITF